MTQAGTDDDTYLSPSRFSFDPSFRGRADFGSNSNRTGLARERLYCVKSELATKRSASASVLKVGIFFFILRYSMACNAASADVNGLCRIETSLARVLWCRLFAFGNSAHFIHQRMKTRDLIGHHSFPFSRRVPPCEAAHPSRRWRGPPPPWPATSRGQRAGPYTPSFRRCPP